MRGKRFVWIHFLAVLGLILSLGMAGQAQAALCTPEERAQYLESCLAATQNALQPSGDRAPGLAAPPATEPDATDEAAIAPYTYARVNGYAAVYRSPEDAAAGRGAVRSVGGGYVFVSMDQEPLYVEHNGVTSVRINTNEYVRADRLTISQPSAFQGVVLSEQPAQPFAWVLKATQPSPQPGAAPNPDAATLERYTLVTILDRKTVGGVYWSQIGPEQWIKHVHVAQVSVAPRPARIGANDKWIEINLYEQTLAAYEGDRMVYATVVSTGLPQWFTPQGLTKVWWKLRAAKMSGSDGKPDYYFLEDVPWIMYINGAVALHGAYWHDNFGRVHSHGCVNLAPRDARWLFEWTTPVVPEGENEIKPNESDPGTWVWVHG